MGASSDQPRERSATAADLRQLLGAVALIELVVAGLAYLSREYFGPRTAVLVGLGIGAFVLAVFALVAAVSLLVSFGHDAVTRLRRGQRHNHAG